MNVDMFALTLTICIYFLIVNAHTDGATHSVAFPNTALVILLLGEPCKVSQVLHKLSERSVMRNCGTPLLHCSQLVFRSKQFTLHTAMVCISYLL